MLSVDGRIRLRGPISQPAVMAFVSCHFKFRSITNFEIQNCQINNYHFIGKCKHPKVDDASTFLFRSKVGKFDTFDWLLDFVKLPTVPTALISFNGRIWAFDDANTYKIEPNNLFNSA